MLTTSTQAAPPVPPDSTNTAKTAAVEASARASFRQDQRVGIANENRVANEAAKTAAAQRSALELPDPMSSLSTVAVAGAMGSLPAALNMMRNIAMASASGSLSDADRLALQTKYSQLSAKIVTSVGSAGAGEQAQTSTSHEEQRQADAGSTRREDSDDHRTTATRTLDVSRQTVQYAPVEHTTTEQTQTPTGASQPARRNPRAGSRAQQVHVGTDSSEPATPRQSFSSPATPEAGARIETHAQTQRSLTTQAAQITQFVQVAQSEHVATVVAVA